MKRTIPLILLVLLTALGCAARNRDAPRPRNGGAAYLGAPQQVTYAAVQAPHEPLAREASQPLTLRHGEPPEPWPLTLEEAVRMAMHRSQVVRDLGGRVVEAPAAVTTAYGPALQDANPRTGVEAALAAFDTQFATGLFWDHDERTFNNVIFGGGAAGLTQNTTDFSLQLSKTAATGTRLSLRNLTNYNRNNVPINRFPSVWDTLVEAEVRHPLLQGGGLEYNRIAGPNALPGQYNGVVLARINTDVAAVDFEISIRNLVRDVEQTYWELYFAYRDLDAKQLGRQAARETWEVVRDKVRVGREDQEREALVSEQFYAAQAEVENALAGDATTPGVHAIERRLRWLLGLPASDGRLIRPADEPSRVDVVFAWEEVLHDALWRRAELRRQQWEVKRRELELTAARNLLKMRLDVVSQYRFRGFGDHLLGGDAPNSGAIGDLLTGDLQGWRMGLELSSPVGNRIGHTAVRHAQLELARQRDLYREQELRISHEVSAAYAELDRSYQLTCTNFNRSQAAIRQWRSISEKYNVGFQNPNEPEILLENVLAAQSRAVQGTTAFYRSLVQYNQAIMRLHLAKGSLLDYHQVYLSEGPHSAVAQASAQRQSQRLVPRQHDCLQVPGPIAAGPFEQRHLEPATTALLPSTPAADSFPPAPALQAGSKPDSATAPGSGADHSAPAPEPRPEEPSEPPAEKPSARSAPEPTLQLDSLRLAPY